MYLIIEEDGTPYQSEVLSEEFKEMARDGYCSIFYSNSEFKEILVDKNLILLRENVDEV